MIGARLEHCTSPEETAINTTQVSAAPPAPRPLWQRSALVMVFIVVGLIIVEAIDAATHFDLDSAGIEPRQLDGLDGVLWSPFLHANWDHLWANLTVGVVLGFILLLARRFVFVTAVVWVTSGLGVWLFAPSGSVTVGASGVIFGWLAYLLVRGLFNLNIWQILGGVVLLAIYGSVLWGILPTDPTVSWQGHLFGAIGGVLAAWFLADRDRRRRRPKPNSPTVTGGST